MGKAKPRQMDLFVAAADLQAPGHPFHDRLNKALEKHGFDAKVEALCAELYAGDGAGRPSILPGQYFRMLMVGYFEGIASETGIASYFPRNVPEVAGVFRGVISRSAASHDGRSTVFNECRIDVNCQLRRRLWVSIAVLFNGFPM